MEKTVIVIPISIIIMKKGGDDMEKQILDLLNELNVEVKSMRTDMTGMKSEMNDMRTDMTGMKSEMNDMRTDMTDMKSEMSDMKSEMHQRFNTIEAKLDGIGGQFELTNESRMNDVDFIANKVNKLEREVFILKHKSNN
jgi:predicted  nucleic acid-binding Zn-ribbon protein